MIKFNEIYSINNGQETIVFSEEKGNSIFGKYDSGTLTGKLEGNTLKATYHNQKNNGTGLIEIEFNKNGFNAKWKQGLKEGPMRGKWEGKLEQLIEPNTTSNLFLINLEDRKVEVSDYSKEKYLVWSEAIDYCDKLGDGWRFPSIEELETIYSQLAYKGIENFQSDMYWSDREATGEFGPELVNDYIVTILMPLGTRNVAWKLN
jgi:hypothetical protein